MSGPPTADAAGERLRVVVVDDHALFRAGVIAELGDRFDIVGEAADVADATALITETEPDVVLLDVHLPNGDGRSVIESVASAMGPSEIPRFLALSVSDSAIDVIGLVRAGARGYVTKRISTDELADAITRLADGDAVFSPRLAGFVLDAFSADAPPVDAPPLDPDIDVLTAREQEVMRYLARGYAYKEIARRLSISVKTVETHASAVLRKLQLSSRNELARWAYDRRLVE